MVGGGLAASKARLLGIIRSEGSQVLQNREQLPHINCASNSGGTRLKKQGYTQVPRTLGTLQMTCSNCTSALKHGTMYSGLIMESVVNAGFN